MLVTDPTLGTTLASLASLAVGASVTYTASTTVTQAEIDSGNAVPNTAVVTDDQNSVAVLDGHHAGVAVAGGVDREVGDLGRRRVRRSGGDLRRRGDRLQVVVSNTGNETLTNVVVTDPTLGTTLASLATLAVGASVTYTAIDDGHPGRARQRQRGAQHRGGDRHTELRRSRRRSPRLWRRVPGVSIVKSVTSVGGASGDPAATYAGEAIDYRLLSATPAMRH